jgi:Ala-tRNA(Pro) deacylase
MPDKNTVRDATKRADLFAHLDGAGIAHTTLEHPPVFTVDEGVEIKKSLPGGHTKNLFLKDKKGALYLVCALGETKIAVNHLHKALGCKRLSFGKPDLLLEVLGVPAGSVCLFALLNDRGNHVTLVLDKALYDHELVNFHPLANTATTTIAAHDMDVFAKNTGHEPILIDFAKLLATHING